MRLSFFTVLLVFALLLAPLVFAKVYIIEHEETQIGDPTDHNNSELALDVFGALRVSGNITMNGSVVCTAANGLCGVVGGGGEPLWSGNYSLVYWRSNPLGFYNSSTLVETDPFFNASAPNLCWANGTGCPISPGGGPNNTMWNKTVNGATEYLFPHNLNMSIGLGTESPQTMLDVRGDAQIYASGTSNVFEVRRTDAPVSYFSVTDSTTGAGLTNGLLVGYNYQGLVLNREATDLSFGTSDIVRMVIDATGEIGIGNEVGANPSYPLQIKSDAYNSYPLYVENTNTTAGPALYLRSYSSGGGSPIFLLQYGGGSTAINTRDNGKTGFGGVTSPQGTVHIRPTATNDEALIIETLASQSENPFEVQNSSSDNLAFITPEGRLVLPAYTDQTNPTISFGEGDEDTGFYSDAGNLWVSVQGAKRFVFTGNAFVSDQNNGMGLFNEVASSTNPTLVPDRLDVDTGIGATPSNGNNLSLITGGVERVRIDDNGDVGIGTSSPAANLEVAASDASPIGLFVDSDGHAYVDIDSGISRDAYIRFFDSGVGKWTVGKTRSAFNNDLIIRDDSTVTNVWEWELGGGAIGYAQASTDVPLQLRGAASQSANLQEWQNNTGDAVASVGPRGEGYFSGNTANGVPFTIENVGTSSANNVFEVKLADGNSYFHMDKNALFTMPGANTELIIGTTAASNFRLDPNGFELYSTTTKIGEMVKEADRGGGSALSIDGVVARPLQLGQSSQVEIYNITTEVATAVPLIVKGHSAQTNNITEWSLEGGAILASVDASGDIFASDGQVCTNANGLCAGGGYTWELAAEDTPGQTTINSAELVNFTGGSGVTVTREGNVLEINASAGSGDISAVYTNGNYLLGGSDTGDVSLLLNETYLNATIDDRSGGAETDPLWTGNQSSYYLHSNPLSYYNSTTIPSYLESESDPLWNGNSTLVSFLADNEIVTGTWNFTDIHSDDWTNITITESQVTDLDHYTDADIDGSETAFNGWDKDDTDDLPGGSFECSGTDQLYNVTVNSSGVFGECSAQGGAGAETDPLWTGNQSLYYEYSNPLSYYNATTIPSYLEAETDPLWTGNQSSYYTRANPLGFYNSSNYAESDPLWSDNFTSVYLRSNPLGFYNSSNYGESDPLWDGNSSLVLTTSTSWSGDLSGTGDSPEVTDSSHEHAAENLTSGNLDIARLPTGGDWSITSDLSVNTNYLFVESSALEVGIGTAEPEATLHVNNSITGQPNLLVTDDRTNTVRFESYSGNQAVRIMLNDTLQKWYIMKETTEEFKIKDETAGTTPFTIEEGGPSNTLYLSDKGNVSIGTVSEYTALYVSGAVNMTGALTVSGGGASTIAGALTINKGLTVDTDTLHIDSTNDGVGIGTTNPIGKLEVTGNLNVTQGNISITTGTNTGQICVNATAIILAAPGSTACD